MGVKVSSRDKRTLNKWKERLLKRVDSDLATVDALVSTGIRDEEDLAEIQKKKELAESITLEEEGPVQFINDLVRVLGVNKHKYGDILEIEKKYYKHFVNSEGWVNSTSYIVSAEITMKFEEDDYNNKILSTGPNRKDEVKGMVITIPEIWKIADDKIPALEEHKLEKKYRDLFIVDVIHGIVTYANSVGWTIIVKKISHGHNNLSEITKQNPMVDLFREFGVDLGEESLEIFVSETNFETPDVYTPDDSETRKRFLDMYYRAGFNSRIVKR